VLKRFVREERTIKREGEKKKEKETISTTFFEFLQSEEKEGDVCEIPSL